MVFYDGNLKLLNLLQIMALRLQYINLILTTFSHQLGDAVLESLGKFFKVFMT